MSYKLALWSFRPTDIIHQQTIFKLGRCKRSCPFWVCRIDVQRSYCMDRLESSRRQGGVWFMISCIYYEYIQLYILSRASRWPMLQSTLGEGGPGGGDVVNLPPPRHKLLHSGRCKPICSSPMHHFTATDMQRPFLFLFLFLFFSW